MPKLSIIIATVGRCSILNTLASLTPQLEDGDEVLIERLDCPWGGQARNKGMRRAGGTHLMFMDDDDEYLPGALELVRDAVSFAPRRVHLFGMVYRDGLEIRPELPVLQGTVGTPMMCVPNTLGMVGTWSDRYEQDYDFAASTLELRGEDPIVHDEMIALVTPRNGR